MSEASIDIDAIDFFRDDEVVADPYPYSESLRSRCPVHREPRLKEHSCPGGPLARMEARDSIERILDRMAEIRISEAHHGPAGARRYQYLPTYILRGLTRLHLGFTPAGAGDD